MEIYNYISLIIAVIAMVVSILALIYTVKTYLLKTGDRIRGGFSVCSSIACEDVYISNIAVENYKDKSVVIYKIYLQIGHNYFIELEEFEDNPLVLNPFEAYTQKYDPIEFYSINTYKIQMNRLLRDKRTKKRLVLSTSNGKYTIRKQLKH